MRKPSRIRRTLLPCLAGAVLLALFGPGARPAEGLGRSTQVDTPSPYEPQVTCTTGPQPGTVALAHWLMRTYPATGSLGMMRGCGIGGTSEHKDGRAFDWAADVSRRRTRRAAFGFIRRALATDAAGNAHALARRLGIMYLIYDDTIWSSYRDFVPRPYLNPACTTITHCSRTLRHLNHVHISLGYAGAAAQTSWYRARGIPAKPVLYPGTEVLNPDETAVVSMSVGPDGRTASSAYLLRAGVTYRIVATGTVAAADGSAGDANCTWSTGPSPTLPVPAGRGPAVDPNPVTPDPIWYPGWSPDPVVGSAHAQSLYAVPLPSTRALLLHGAVRWDQSACAPDHTYEAWYRPLVDERLQLRYADPVVTGNRGWFTVYVARDDILASSLAAGS